MHGNELKNGVNTAPHFPGPLTTPAQESTRFASRQAAPAPTDSPSVPLRSPQWFSSLPQSLVFLTGDALSVLLAHATAQVLGQHSSSSITLAWGGAWLAWRAYQGLYPGYGRSPQTELRLHAVSTLQILALQLLSALALQRLPAAAPAALLEWLLILLLALPVRYVLRAAMIRGQRFGRAVSVIGGGQTADLIIAYLQRHPTFGLNPVAAYDDNPSLHGTHLHGVPILDGIAQAIRQPLTRQALISIPSARAEAQQRLVNSVYEVFPSTWVIPDLFGVPNHALVPHNMGSVATLELRNNLLSINARLLKRTLDVLGTAAGLLLLLPVFLLLALIIKLDSPGPAFYQTTRLGRHGRPFRCFKFRSMHQNAEQRLTQMLRECPEYLEEYETFHKLRNDPRITRVGAFLRRTSLDELPQLLNVLLGQMSLVGPRPYLPGEQSKLGDSARAILVVRPGMTGYWQVNDRSHTTFQNRIGMDLFYIANWSIWLDLVILIQTVRAVILGKGAY